MLDEPTAKLLALKNAIVAIGGMTGAFMVALFFMPDDMRVHNPWIRTAALGWVGGSFAVISYVIGDIAGANAETGVATRNSDISYSLWVNYMSTKAISNAFSVRVTVEGKLK